MLRNLALSLQVAGFKRPFYDPAIFPAECRPVETHGLNFRADKGRVILAFQYLPQAGFAGSSQCGFVRGSRLFEFQDHTDSPLGIRQDNVGISVSCFAI